MSILGSLGLDPESPRWQRAVKVQKAFHFDFGVVGIYLEVTNRTDHWLAKLEARVRLVQPPPTYDPVGAETSLAEQWIKLIRDPERPAGPRNFHDDTGVMDLGEKARLWCSASYYDGSGPIPTRIPDIVEITGLRATMGHGRIVKTVDLRRHSFAIAPKPPKDWP